MEENSQEEQASVDSVESMEEQVSQEVEEEEQSAVVEEEESEQLDMEQVPIGVDKIVSERNGKVVEGEQLVFSNPETDAEVLNILYKLGLFFCIGHRRGPL